MPAEARVDPGDPNWHYHVCLKENEPTGVCGVEWRCDRPECFEAAGECPACRLHGVVRWTVENLE